MGDSLLQSLRARAIDESEPLAGLLRKCLLLGAETGSTSLRDWARLELNGYVNEESVPDYRQLGGAPMTMDSMSGNMWATGQTLTRLQVPPTAREYVNEVLNMTQPVEELERLAQEKTLHFKPPGLALAQTVWNSELGPYQQIVNLSFVVAGSVFAGIVGQIRTNLVDLVADLTIATPLTELPRREDVDAAVTHRIGHVGDVYTSTVIRPTGPVAIGAGASASAGITVQDALALLAAVQQAVDDSDAGTDTSEVTVAVEELTTALEAPHPDAGEITRRAGRLRTVADKLGVAAVTSATSAAVTTLIELVMQGTLG